MIAKKTRISWTQRLLHPAAIMRTAVLVGVLSIAGVGFMQSSDASAVQTSNDYCSQYSVNSQRNACKDGIKGTECNDYAITFDQETADICRKAAKAKADGLISDTPSFSPSPSTSTPHPPTGQDVANEATAYKNAILAACAPYQHDTAAALWCLYGGLGQNGTEGKPKTIADCLSKPELQGSDLNQGACITGATAGNAYLTAQNSGRDSSSNPNAILDQLDVANNLSQIINILHAVGPNAGLDTSNIADNSYGSYVNGAGKKQPIKVYPSGISNAPAIVFFNGGGWHVNDGTSYCVAIGSPQKNCQPGQNGGADTGARNIGAPAGGGALQRGYTAIEVTYRLGSSGVYYMLEDVMRGLRHVINNAGLYDIDPSKVAIWGDSAGGSLAMRVAATGKSGAKAAVGWSAPTNAYTALFKSFSSFLIGMDHSTCIPTDLAGAANTTNLLNGGSGDVAEYGQGLSSNDFSLLGIGGESDAGSNPIGAITQVLTAAQYAAETGKNIEAISKQLETAYNDGEPDMESIMNSGLPSSVFNLSAKKLTECIDNFNTLSPALFASPESTPSFLAGFDTDNLIDPQQLYDMRDKLRSLGIRSDALVLPGDAEAGTPAIGASENHLGYDPRFVCESINFIDSVMQPDKGTVDCGTGLVNNSGGGVSGGGGGGGEVAGGGVSGGGGGGGNGCTASAHLNTFDGPLVRLAAAVRPGDTVQGQGDGTYKITSNCSTPPRTSTGNGCVRSTTLDDNTPRILLTASVRPDSSCGNACPRSSTTYLDHKPLILFAAAVNPCAGASGNSKSGNSGSGNMGGGAAVGGAAGAAGGAIGGAAGCAIAAVTPPACRR